MTYLILQGKKGLAVRA